MHVPFLFCFSLPCYVDSVTLLVYGLYIIKLFENVCALFTLIMLLNLKAFCLVTGKNTYIFMGSIVHRNYI